MPAMFAPLPATVRTLLDRGLNTHPGLALDKYAASWSDTVAVNNLSELVQKPTIDAVAALSHSPAGLDWQSLRTRRERMLCSLQAISLKASTTGPFTLHLSRASALENAGVCLHPVYGFVYLPGTGIKGMARAYAETVWAPTHPNRDEARRTIEEAFGWTKWLDESSERAPECAGSVVFHEAWPLTWPRLRGDILNSHHAKYYGDEGRNPIANAPGDWELPIPVSFLSVPPGETFEFAVSKRLHNSPHLDLAVEWLIGALEHMGAGAKTAAGYGAFQVDQQSHTTARGAATATWNAIVQKEERAQECVTVELVTPAFLAGLHQPQDSAFSPSECTLREATLRGQLRWWWRTMHAGWVDVAALRRLEAIVWGDTHQGGAARILIEPVGTVAALPFDRWTIIRGNKLPDPVDDKTTPGLTYHSYGMDEKKAGIAVRRYFVSSGVQWRITIVSRWAIGSAKPPVRIPAGMILDQVRAALWLLTEFGGVGSKSRKGFGNLRVTDWSSPLDLAQCRSRAVQFRRAIGLADSVIARKAESPSLEQSEQVEEVTTPWTNVWFVLDRLADAAQSFAKLHKHDPAKKALGLPRKIPQPFGSFRAGKDVQKTDRHASPIHYRLILNEDGTFRVRMIAFPSAQLPADSTLDLSRQFLKQALSGIRDALLTRVAAHATEGREMMQQPAPVTMTQQLPLVIRKSGDWISAVIEKQKSGKGKWMARDAQSKKLGVIQNSEDVPSDKKPGDTVTLVIASADTNPIQFRWPTAIDEARKTKAAVVQTKPKRRK